MKILIVLTSHDTLGDTGRKTGFWLEEFATPYYVFKDAGAEITLASPKGGQPPLDPKSTERDFQTAATDRFNADKDAQDALAHTIQLSDISPADYDALFYPGGHGPLWDLAEDTHSISLIEAMYAQGKPVSAVCHAPGVFRNTRLPDGSPLVQGKSVTGFSNTEESAVGLTNDVPFLVEDELRKIGGKYSKGAAWLPYSVRDGNLVTGQNPASSEAVAKAVLDLLKQEQTCEGKIPAQRSQSMNSRDEYVRKMQAKLEEWNAEIDTLTAKAGKVTADVRNEYSEQIAGLKAKQAAARQKIEGLQHSGEHAWEDLKSGIDRAWTAMGEAIDSARSRFK